MSRVWLDRQHDEIVDRNRRNREAEMQEALRQAAQRNQDRLEAQAKAA
jgi:Zn-finger nucleic acid-binding protein